MVANTVFPCLSWKHLDDPLATGQAVIPHTNSNYESCNLSILWSENWVSDRLNEVQSLQVVSQDVNSGASETPVTRPLSAAGQDGSESPAMGGSCWG